MRRINVQILQIKDGMLHLEGNQVKLKLPEKSRLVIKSEDGKIYDIGHMSYAVETRRQRFYCADLPLKVGARYGLYVLSEGGKMEKLEPIFGKFSRLTNLDNSYFVFDDYIIKHVSKEIRVYKNALKTRLASAHRFNNTLKEIAGEDVLRLRKKAEKLRRSSKPIWLISDRTDLAGDNGEVLFEYLMKSDAKNKYDISYLIREDCPDYERIRKIGPVIGFGTEDHLVHVLAATLNISSSGDEWVFNPFSADRIYYRDMLDSKFVFLQHGVIKDDLSDWLQRSKKNISIFVTSTKAEYDSICGGNYGYDGNVVKLTGLPRHDKLWDSREKKIAFMPSWRNGIAPNLIPGTSEREYSDEFKESEYCKFYNRLINDERIISAMKERGYTGVFYLHPNHRKQAPDFMGNDRITVWSGENDYTKIFGESALIVTDYSSVFFDFAYLRKPVIYTQFDRESFYSTHTYSSGYFDYERDGFGPVCLTYEETVAAIVSAIENDCATPGKYLERINSSLPFDDKGNCRRVLEEIEKL